MTAIKGLFQQYINGEWVDKYPLTSWEQIINKPTTFTPSAHTHDYLPLSGGTLSGELYVNLSSTDKPSYRLNKSGSYFTGIGYHGTANETYFGAVDGNGDWTNSNVESFNFGGSIKENGTLLANKYLSLSGGTIASASGDAPLAIQSNSNASWLQFKNSSGVGIGFLGINASNYPCFFDTSEGEKRLALYSDIGNATLTIQAEGTAIDSFSANATSDKIINITASALGLSGALKFIGTTTTALTDGATTNPIVINNSNVTAVAGNVVIYGNKEFLYNNSAWEELGDESSHALKSITITGTGALSGGGSLEQNRTITLNSGGADTLSMGLYKFSTDSYSRIGAVTSVTAGDIPDLSGYYLSLSGGTLSGILNSRSIVPVVNNSYNLGTSDYKYNAIYGTNILANYSEVNTTLQVGFPNYPTLISAGYLRSDYESADYPTEDFCKAICRWAINTYSNKGDIELIGTIAPNSSGTCILHLYSSSGKDSSNNPRYCSGIYLSLEGVSCRFGFANYTWYLTTLASTGDLNNYLQLSGGNMSGNINFGDNTRRIGAQDGSTLTRYNGSTITLPSGSGKGIAMIADEGGDFGLLYIGSDGAAIANSGDNGYIFKVYDKDQNSSDFTSSSGLAFGVKQAGGGVFAQGNFETSGDIYENGTTLANKYLKRKESTLESAIDLNSVVSTGFYMLADTYKHGPDSSGDNYNSGIGSYAQLLVGQSGNDTLFQMLFRYNTPEVYLRTGYNIGVSGYTPVFSDWKKIANASDIQTNTWRPINVNGTLQINDTSTSLNFIAQGSASVSFDSDTKSVVIGATNTKNTAGSTDTSSKIFLIGATSQAANPQTYSDNEVFATNGVLSAKSFNLAPGATTKATMQYNTTDDCIEFVFAS